MKLVQQGRRKQQARSRAKARSLNLMTAHRAFPPLLAVWGALLGGLPVMVLPPVLIERSLSGTLIGTLDLPVQPILAGFAAIVLGGVLLAVASVLRRRAGTPSLAERATRWVNPIDPARDLGSRSLDEPIETPPFATPAWRDADPSVAEPVAAAGAAPRALDLAEFGELPGRNGVWVEEVTGDDTGCEAARPPAALTDEVRDVAAPVASLPRAVPAPTSLPSPAPEPGTAALARLRAVPPSELSLAEMVERFAGALHEHRATTPARALSEAELAAREAALAEALKALAALSTDTSPQAARQSLKDPLHAAIAQLQTRRGAA